MDGFLNRLLNLTVCQRAVTVCFRGRFAGGCVDVRVYVLQDVTMCVCVCNDVSREANPVSDISF